MATPTYYLADTTKEWNLKLLKLPTNGEYNLFGDTYSYTDGTNKTNLSIGTAISRNITGSYNLSLGSNVCTALTSGSYNTAVGSSALASITTLSRNLALGYQALSNLTYQATGLSKIILLTGGTYSANISSGIYIFTITVASGPSPTTMPTATYYYTANTTGQGGFINGNITNVTLINSGSGFSSSTTFTLSTPSIGTGSPSATYSFVYDDPNSGNDNIAIGYQALNTTQYSVRNIAIGSYALTNLSQTLITRELLDNIALGFNSQFGSVLGVNNISIGNYSLAGNTLSSLYYAPSNIICIGNNAMSNIRTNGANSICIGNSSMNSTITNSATTDNICIGNSSMTALNGGYQNLCIGNSSGIALTNGYFNLCVGNNSGKGCTSGNDNTFVGHYAGSKPMSASYKNVAIGSNVLSGTSGNFTGYYNTFINSSQHSAITTGYDNFIAGQRAGTQITSGNTNVLIGPDAGYSAITGYNNVGLGYQVLGSNSNTGLHDNVAIGYQSAAFNPGNYNVCIGPYAGLFLDYVSGSNASQNVFIGYNAGYGGIISSTYSNRSTNCVAIGTNAGYNLTTGTNNTFIGAVSATTATLTTTGSNMTTIGYNAAPTAATTSNQIVFGSGITNLKCATTTITTTSDMRDKKDIVDLPLGIDFLNKVRPVKFMWDMRPTLDASGNEVEDLDVINRKGKIEAGFIAQELDQVEEETGNDWLGLVFKENPERLEATAGKLLPIMVKAIQELSAKVESLTQELALLKAM